MDTSSSSVIKRHLIEPIKLEANIKRSLLPSCNEIPIIDCSATLDFIKVFLLFVSRCSYFPLWGQRFDYKVRWTGHSSRYTHNALVSFAGKKKNEDRESIAKDVKFCSNFTIPTTLICLVLFLMFASEEHLLTMNGIFSITLEGKQEFGVRSRLQLLLDKFESSHNLFAG